MRINDELHVVSFMSFFFQECEQFLKHTKRFAFKINHEFYSILYKTGVLSVTICIKCRPRSVTLIFLARITFIKTDTKPLILFYRSQFKCNK